MTEIVLDTNTLPEPLVRIIKAEKVRVNEARGMIELIPVAGGDRTLPDKTAYEATQKKRSAWVNELFASLDEIGDEETPDFPPLKLDFQIYGFSDEG
jgi:hypothetical protein